MGVRGQNPKEEPESVSQITTPLLFWFLNSGFWILCVSFFHRHHFIWIARDFPTANFFRHFGVGVFPYE